MRCYCKSATCRGYIGGIGDNKSLAALALPYEPPAVPFSIMIKESDTDAIVAGILDSGIGLTELVWD